MRIFLPAEKKSPHIDVDDGITVRSLAEKLNLTAPDQAVAVSINGHLKDQWTTLKEGDKVEFWNFSDKIGKEVFWHTSAHVLAQAILRLYPEAKPTIGPPIEAGFYYDFGNLKISEEDFPKIEEEVEKIIKENYQTERVEFASAKAAKKEFENNTYKLQLIDSFEAGVISGYKQGEFFDLCRGPHLANIGKIKAFKILKTSGAYWKGDSKNEMLTRVYAISFPDRKMLKDYLFMLEEAKKRDHKLLGPRLDLFSTKEQAPGIPFIHAKGMIIWNRLIDFWRKLHKDAGYVEIKTPHIMSQELWEMSGHWKYYRENMYAFSIEDRYYAIKPMNCPGCMLYYKSALHSYRELPLRIAELGHVHRHEASGALNGLFRVRSFHQDDAHLFMEPHSIKEEILQILKLVEKTYSVFGLPYRLELSTRPKDSIGTDADWKLATEGLKDALDEWDQPYKINEGDGAFYGPKIDIHIQDALGRSWQCGTIQLDMALPERFSLEYVDSHGDLKRPIMLHRAIFGSVERFFGILIEHFAGRLPFWISPRQVRIITVADRHIPYAKELEKKLLLENLAVELDDSAESVGKKVRNAQLDQVNYMITLGDKEVENHKLAVRTRQNELLPEVDEEYFIKTILEEIKTKSLNSLLTPNISSTKGS